MELTRFKQIYRMTGLVGTDFIWVTALTEQTMVQTVRGVRGLFKVTGCRNLRIVGDIVCPKVFYFSFLE